MRLAKLLAHAGSSAPEIADAWRAARQVLALTHAADGALRVEVEAELGAIAQHHAQQRAAVEEIEN